MPDQYLTTPCSKKIISNILKPCKDFLAEKNIELKDGTVLSMISKAKSKGVPAADYLNFARFNKQKTRESGVSNIDPCDVDQIVAEIYEGYETALRRSNSVDFDDLLIYGVKLFTKHKAAVEWCQHVLVDELWVSYPQVSCLANQLISVKILILLSMN